MSSFVENEAAEGSEEEEEEVVVKVKDEDKDSEDFDSSEDDDVPNEYEQDDFLVGDEEAGGEENEDEDDEARSIKKKKKKRKRGREEIEMEEGDLDLLEEAGVKVKKKGKLRRLERDASEDESDREVRNQGKEDSRRRGPDEDIDYDDDEGDEMDNFIEDDEGDRRRRKGGADEVHTAALEDAREIFGDQKDVDELQGIDFLVVSDDEDGKDAGPMLRKEEANEETQINDMEDLRKLTIKVDPSLARERLLTDRDEEIRSKDMPEYLQEHFGHRRRAHKEDLGEEAEWIYQSAFSSPDHDEYEREATIGKISVLLAFLHVETLDIPFVAVYRKEYIMGDLMKSSGFDELGDWTSLWTVMDWDRRWSHLTERKKNFLEQLNKAPEARIEDDTNILKNLTDEAGFTNDLMQINTLERHVTLLQEKYYSTTGAADTGEEKGRRRPRRRERYRFLCKSGLGELAKHFGISASQLSENLQKYQSLHRPADPASEPQDVAITWASSQSRSSTLDDPTTCLQLARSLITTEIISESGIMRHVRSAFRSSAKVSTMPTSKARKQVDDDNPLRPFCTVQNKPLALLTQSGDGEFLMMHQVEKEGLATIELSMNETDYQELVDDLNRFYLSQSLSATAMSWNDQRRMILKEALGAIIEEVKRELRKELLDRAILQQKAALTLSIDRELHQGPVKIEGLEQSPKTLAITVTSKDEDEDVQGDSQEATAEARKRYAGSPQIATFVALDADGEVIGTNEVPAGWLRRRRDDPIPEEISNFLWKHVIQVYEPNCIAIGIGSGGQDATRLRDDILALLGDYFRREELDYLGVPRDDERDFQDLERSVKERIILVPDTLVTPYAKTKLAIASLAELSYLQRRGVGLARLTQEPLTVYAAIVADKQGYRDLPLTNNGRLLPAEVQKDVLRRSMIRSVNTVGFDINRAIIHSHLRPLLQYVGGLGPRKAKSLLQAIETSENGMLISRRDMLVKNMLGNNTFYSASGFLRVRDPELASGGKSAAAIRKRLRKDKKKNVDRFADYEPLEDTRMHLENYNVAIKIAEQSVEDASKRKDPSAVVFELMENPELLEALDLEQYAKDLETKGRGKNRETVRLIEEEFNEPYRDWRVPLTEPTPKVLFRCITGMDPDTQLHIGSMVTAEKLRVIDSGSGVSCMVANGRIRGFIHKMEFSDQRLTDEELVERVTPGGSAMCRVQELTVEEYKVKLSCRASVLNNPASMSGFQDPIFYDDYCKRYDEIRDEKFLEREKALEKQKSLRRDKMLVQIRKENLANRSTRHPFWKDVTADEAERLMEPAPIGEVIIRPGSTKKSVSFTYKLYQGVVAHFKVNEEMEVINGKENLLYVEANSGPTAERYESLDEVLSRVIDPIVQNYNEAVSFRDKFLNVSWAELQATLRDMKNRDPKRIPYMICPDTRRDRVGSFLLGFVPGTKTVNRASVIVTPDGFKLRNVLHPTPSALYDWFKKNFKTLENPHVVGYPPNTPGRYPPGTPRIGVGTPLRAAPGTPGRGMPGTPLRGGVPSTTILAPDPAPMPSNYDFGAQQPPPPPPSDYAAPGQHYRVPPPPPS
ncbi:hypothetical protein NDN08_000345 [Rhodosorus marinus]|uniref:S1 motif domain-containing protein n=1 Tax=Rhodosorus marinus TaxID=101924 RepID=A0AAV8UR98_9RHOD|nr:hypothetical protein NDN08_000345 [Rhodosorus marinus]